MYQTLGAIAFGVSTMSQRHFTFLLASARADGNAEQLARHAAAAVAPANQTWLRLNDLTLPAFEDIRHSVGTYPQPTGHAKTLLDATLACTDLVFVTPLYWYSLPTAAKRYLDEWSGWLRVPDLDFKKQMAPKTMWAICSSSGEAAEATGLFLSLRFSADYMGMRWGGSVLGNGNKPGEIMHDATAIANAAALFS